MLKVFITAKNGFIGSFLTKFLSTKYEIISTTRSELDLTDPTKVKEFLLKHNFDVIINTASKGGQKGHSNSPHDLYNNLAITFNLLRFKNPSTVIFNFSSGYELDYENEYEGLQRNVCECFPLDCYGMSKNVISRICKNYSNVYTFRIYGMYGEEQPNDRWIKKTIIDYINHQPLNAYINRKVDFVYINDLGKLTEYYLKNIHKTSFLDSVIDLALPKKYNTSDILTTINNLDDYRVPINIQNNLSIDYTGNGERFSAIIPDYVDITQGISLIYKNLLKNRL